MNVSRFSFALALASGLVALPISAVEENCQDCHDTAPISADHMEVGEFTLEECGMCHASEPGDELFEAIHKTHTDVGIDCAECHGSGVTEEQRSTLQQILDG